eukprot:2962069-Rhodomonas_salina.4
MRYTARFCPGWRAPKMSSQQRRSVSGSGGPSVTTKPGDTRVVYWATSFNLDDGGGEAQPPGSERREQLSGSTRAPGDGECRRQPRLAVGGCSPAGSYAYNVPTGFTLQLAWHAYPRYPSSTRRFPGMKAQQAQLMGTA